MGTKLNSFKIYFHELIVLSAHGFLAELIAKPGKLSKIPSLKKGVCLLLRQEVFLITCFYSTWYLFWNQTRKFSWNIQDKYSINTNDFDRSTPHLFT